MDITTTDILTLIITNIPSFSGFILLAVFSWRVIDRQMIIIERLSENCMRDSSRDSESVRAQYQYNQEENRSVDPVGESEYIPSK